MKSNRVKRTVIISVFFIALLTLSGIIVIRSYKTSNCNYDLNNDGIVNESDQEKIYEKFGLKCDKCPEDLNKDGVIDGSDVLIMIGKFGSLCK